MIRFLAACLSWIYAEATWVKKRGGEGGFEGESEKERVFIGEIGVGVVLGWDI